MTYDYYVYYRQNCIIPIILLLVSFVLFFGQIYALWKERLTYSPKDIVYSIFFLCIAFYLIIANIVPLARGGIYLLVEKERDAIQVSGTVERTVEIDFVTGAKYHVENNNGSGEAIVVNGRKYYLTTYDDIHSGDHVAMDVLPRSGFVLKIERNND